MNNYLTIANEFTYIGGGIMVDVNTVIDMQTGQTLFVNISDDEMTISTVNIVKTELPDDIDATKFIKYSIDCAEWTHSPAPNNTTINDLPEDIFELFDDCLERFIINKVERTHQIYRCHPDQLPTSLYKMMPVGYEKWLSDHNQMVETSGYRLIINPLFEAESTDDENIQAAFRLKKDLEDWMPDADADLETVEKFYDSTIQLIVNGKLYQFYNCAAVYNGLDALAQRVIDEF